MKAPATWRREPTVAVLGAGIMGSSVALQLARRGFRVVMIDKAPAAFCGASRWNEGKIHLGYLYGADPSLATAKKLLPGGLAFPRLVEQLVGAPVPESCITPRDDVYLVHGDSVVGVDQVFSVAERVFDLGLEHPDAKSHFVRLEDHRPRRLTVGECESFSDSPDITGGFTVPERSVATDVIADLFVSALAGEARLEQLFGRRVVAVTATEASGSRWQVVTSSDGEDLSLGPFDAVVNALWEGRGAIDAGLGITRSATWTHRYRVSLFATAAEPLDLPSAVVCVGPFGDIKNYDGSRLYLSWYEAGLRLTSHAVIPPPPPVLTAVDRERITSQTLESLGAIFPAVRGLRARLSSAEVRGGWVYAAGTGSLVDRASDLHRRDEIGLISKGSYFSIDTGKYSIAPWLSVHVADAVCEAMGR